MVMKKILASMAAVAAIALPAAPAQASSLAAGGRSAVYGGGPFYNGGQSCSATERVYVHEAIADAFTASLADLVGADKVGPNCVDKDAMPPGFVSACFWEPIDYDQPNVINPMSTRFAPSAHRARSPDSCRIHGCFSACGSWVGFTRCSARSHSPSSAR